jgi:hypothetical protein
MFSGLIWNGKFVPKSDSHTLGSQRRTFAGAVSAFEVDIWS